MMDFLIPNVMAAEAGSSGLPGLDILIIVAFALVFYFILWRPQSKRTKEHRLLVSGLAKGDEIVTNGGLIGKITKVEEQYIMVEVAENIELRLQRGAVATALPKGTIKSF